MNEVTSNNPMIAQLQEERSNVEKAAKEAIGLIEKIAGEALDAYDQAILKAHNLLNTCNEAKNGLTNLSAKLRTLGGK